MASSSRPEDHLSRLETLRAMLDAATTILADVAASDSLFPRLWAVFGRMPPEDRELILRILEHEVDSRLLAMAVADAMTGIRLRPNPGARLYVRVVDGEPHLNRDEMVRGTVRAMRMYHRIREGVYVEWEKTAVEAIQALDADERAGVAAFCRRLCELVADCDRAGAATTPV
jgi:hypothetical protein